MVNIKLLNNNKLSNFMKKSILYSVCENYLLNIMEDIAVKIL